MTDLEALNYFLGIFTNGTPTSLFLSQKKYALQLFECAHMITCIPSRTSINTESKLGPKGAPVQDPTLYRSLRTTFSCSQAYLVIWLGSTSGYCVFLGDNLLSWFFKRQHILSRSSTEAEYWGVANVVVETAWLHNLLRLLPSHFPSKAGRHQDYILQTQMGGSSSQPRTGPPRCPINAFSIEELSTPEFLESFQENATYWQEPNPYEAVGSEGSSKRHKSSGFSSFNTESRDASINLNTTVADEDEVHEIRRPEGRDKARANAKNKGSKASGSSTMNDDELARPVSPATAVQVPVILASSHSSTTIDQDAPSPSHSPSSSELQSHISHQGVAAGSTIIEDNHFATADNDPFVNVFVSKPSFEASSSRDISSAESIYVTQPHHHLEKWSKDHPLKNVIGNPSRPVSTRKQLAIDALWNNRKVHLDYFKHLKESVETLSEIVEEARVERPLDRSLASACLYTKQSQELLDYVIDTCLKDFNKRDKKQATTPFNRKKQVTFVDQCETLNNSTQKHVEQLNIQKTNVHVIPSTGVNSCTNASGSKPRSKTKKNRLLKTYVGESLTAQEFYEKVHRNSLFRDDHFGTVRGYGDYVIGDSVISRVYYEEGLGHNLFSVG
nr:hypothetical protein [Tanacetum cinerariifolium]GEW55438.1 hypothetical protein [Tanacetum cinerariifolium]